MTTTQTTTRDELLSIEEVCDRLKVSRSTYNTWRSHHVAPPARRMPNGRVFTYTSELELWLEDLPVVA